MMNPTLQRAVNVLRAAAEMEDDSIFQEEVLDRFGADEVEGDGIFVALIKDGARVRNLTQTEIFETARRISQR